MLFRNEYWFLSNMFRSPIWIDGLYFSCAESAFQSFKTEDVELRKKFRGINGFEAKKLGRKIPLRPDWDSIKIDVMRKVVFEKFNQHPELAEMLIKIPTSIEIVEDNSWNDTYWGRCRGVGQNNLGKIISELRMQYLGIPQNIPFEPSPVPVKVTSTVDPTKLPTQMDIKETLF